MRVRIRQQSWTNRASAIRQARMALIRKRSEYLPLIHPQFFLLSPQRMTRTCCQPHLYPFILLYDHFMTIRKINSNIDYDYQANAKSFCHSGRGLAVMIAFRIVTG